MTPILRKLWSGQYSLPITFWGFYVGGYIATFILTWFISPLFHTQPWRAMIVFILLVPYNVVSLVGFYRSSHSYPLARLWPTLAKVFVCLWEARFVWSMIRGFMQAISEMP